MDFSRFINKQVVNSNDEVGVITSIDKDNVVVLYGDVEKKYKTALTFSKKFQQFLEPDLNKEMDIYLLKLFKEEEQIKLQKRKQTEELSKKVKLISRCYEKLNWKQSFLRLLFGHDFLYPPFAEFKKKYYKYLNYEHKLLEERLYDAANLDDLFIY